MDPSLTHENHLLWKKLAETELKTIINSFNDKKTCESKKFISQLYKKSIKSFQKHLKYYIQN